MSSNLLILALFYCQEIIGITVIKLKDLFKKESQKEAKIPEISFPVKSTVMFFPGEDYDRNALVQYLQTFWDFKTLTSETDNNALTLHIGTTQVNISMVYFPVESTVIKEPAKFSYHWPEAEKNLQFHDAHAIVFVEDESKTLLEKQVILTKITHAMLEVSSCIGVLISEPPLLIKSDRYRMIAEELKTGFLPLDLWIYIGWLRTEFGNSAYTLGLYIFGKSELEVIDSPMEVEEIYTLLHNIGTYVVDKDVTIRDGEILEYDGGKLSASLSSGHFVEDDSIKLSELK